MTSRPSLPDRVTVEGYRHGRVPREVRERQMLDVAEQVFCEHGYTGASIEEICRRAGLKRPLVYTYFGGKTGLYLACYRRARSALDERFAAVSAETESSDRVSEPALRRAFDAISRAYFEFLAASPTSWEMLYGAGAATAGDVAAEIARMREQTIELLASVIARHVSAGVSPAVVTAYAHAASGCGEQLARWWRRSPDIPIEEMSRHASDFIWGGLRTIADTH
jgi:AcrR family transcriptional regulator